MARRMKERAAHESGLSRTDLATLDLILVDYLNLMFPDGAVGDMAPRLLTALSHVMPESYKQTRPKLLRTTLCAVGWKRRDPGQIRLPVPRAAALAIAGLLMSWGQLRMAIATALRHVCSLEQVMRRGQWVESSSARRYAKETRLLKEMAKVDPLVFRFGQRGKEQVAQLIRLGVRSSRFLAPIFSGLQEAAKQGPGQ